MPAYRVKWQEYALVERVFVVDADSPDDAEMVADRIKSEEVEQGFRVVEFLDPDESVYGSFLYVKAEEL